MLKKLFGGKDEFYVQLDESQTPASPTPPAPESTPEPVAAVSEAPATPKKTPGKKSAKKAAKAPVVETTPVVVPQPPAKPTQVAFASADPIPQNIARRSPGPSLNKFKEMARQVKTR